MKRTSLPAHRVRALAILLTALVALTLGCQNPNAPIRDLTAPATNSPTTATTSFPLQVTDGVGRKLTLAQAPQRIVSLAPKNTELLFELGAGEQIVGVTSYCNYPPEAQKLPQIGGFSSKSISLEKVVSLNPDLIISSGEFHAPIIDELERLGLPVLALSGDTFGALRDELTLLGRVTGHDERAAELVKSIDEKLATMREASAKIPPAERVRVYYHIWGEPLMGAGPTSYQGEMVELCGGVNIIDDRADRFPKLSLEVLVARDPQVILTSAHHGVFFSEANLRARPGWNELRAVQSRRIVLLDGDLVSRCSPRLVNALGIVAHAIYPDRFPAVELASPTTAERADAAAEKAP